MAWCLVKEYADKFLAGLKKGEIDPNKMINMTSEERRNYLGKFVGEFNAKYANTLFESKLLLKNQQLGMINWAKKFSGLKEASKNDIIDKISKLDRALNPAEENQFLSDIIEKRLGVSITQKEAETITSLTKKAQDLYDSKLPSWEQSKDYIQTKQQLIKFVRDATPDTIPTDNIGVVKKKLADVLSIQRAIKTGFDLSAPLRQGRAYFGTSEWNGAFKRMFEYAKDPLALDELEVSMMSNKYYEYALKNKSKLGLTMLGEKFTQREEQYGSKLIDKIPFLKGSERAFTGFLNDLRFNRYVNILESLDKAGNSITGNTKAMEDLATVIGASTGRGSLGSAEGAARSLSTVMFSPRWVASRIGLLLNPLTKTGVARQEAIKGLASLAGTSVAILGMAKMAGADVEIDPRSSDFGKIKIGKTRFDITGGLASYITLMSRLIKSSTKSSITGKVNKLNTGKFGSQTGLSLLEDFFKNKTSPFATVVKDILQGETFGGEKVEIDFTDLKKNEAFAKYLADQLLIPLVSADAYDAFTKSSDGAIMGTLSFPASLFGVGVQTY